jgi:hypothetical protein
MKKRSQAQVERQKNHFRDKGKYSEVNKCYGCGKSAGVNYFSHPLTDTGDWGDEALVLCEKCADETYYFTEVEKFLEFKRKNKRGKK